MMKLLKYPIWAALGVYYALNGMFMLFNFENTGLYLNQFQKLNAFTNGWLPYVNNVEISKYAYVVISLMYLLAGLLVFFGIEEGKLYSCICTALSIITIHNPIVQFTEADIIGNSISSVGHLVILGITVMFLKDDEVKDKKE